MELLCNPMMCNPMSGAFSKKVLKITRNDNNEVRLET